MKNIIGISGLIGSGKDEVGNIIERISPIKWKKIKFAGVLKQATAMIIGCTVEQLEDQDFKNTPLGEEWRRWYYSYKGETFRVGKLFSSEEEAMENNYNLIDNRKAYTLHNELLTPRLILQLLGTEGSREVIHPNIWVNATLGNIKPNDKIIITDVRFPNEVFGIKKRNGIVVRVIRPSKISNTTHLSETALNDFNQWDYEIINDGTLEELEEKVLIMLKHFNLIDAEQLIQK